MNCAACAVGPTYSSCQARAVSELAQTWPGSADLQVRVNSILEKPGFSPWGTSAWRPSKTLSADSNTEPQGLKALPSGALCRGAEAPHYPSVGLAPGWYCCAVHANSETALAYGVISHTTPA